MGSDARALLNYHAIHTHCNEGLMKISCYAEIVALMSEIVALNNILPQGAHALQNKMQLLTLRLQSATVYEMLKVQRASVE